MELDEEQKIELIKRAISSIEGWKNLVISLDGNPLYKEKCIELLRKIGGDKQVPIIGKDVDTREDMEELVNYGDLLVFQLENYINLLDKKE